MGALAIVLVVIAVIVLTALLLLVLSRRPAVREQRIATTAHPAAPDYVPRSQHTEYYRPRTAEDKGPRETPMTTTNGPSRRPLPRCPLCNAAVGFDDLHCPKCKHVLKDA